MSAVGGKVGVETSDEDDDENNGENVNDADDVEEAVVAKFSLLAAAVC